MYVIKLQGQVFPESLKIVMNYRQCSENKLVKNISGLNSVDLKSFLSGYYSAISEVKLKEIMLFFDWPFEFLQKDIKPVKSSLNLK